MTNASPSLRDQLLRAFADDTAPARAAANLKGAALVIFGPGSSLALMHLQTLVARGANVVLAVDDWARVEEIAGIPVCTSGQLAAELSRRVPKGTEVKAINFTQNRYGQARFRALAGHLGMSNSRVDRKEAVSAIMRWGLLPRCVELTPKRSSIWRDIRNCRRSRYGASQQPDRGACPRPCPMRCRRLRHSPVPARGIEKDLRGARIPLRPLLRRASIW